MSNTETWGIVLRDRASGAVTRFSPTWWAAWTFALHRPGRLDDEEIPAGLDAVPWWSHIEPSTIDWSGWVPRDREHRPDWPTMAHAQWRREPTPTDICNVHGRCVGTCNAMTTNGVETNDDR